MFEPPLAPGLLCSPFAIRSMNRIMKSKERKQMQTCRDHKALQVCINWEMRDGKWKMEVGVLGGVGGRGLSARSHAACGKSICTARVCHTKRREVVWGSSRSLLRFPPSQVINKRINSFLRTISPLAAIPAHTNCLLSGRNNRRRSLADFVAGTSTFFSFTRID